MSEHYELVVPFLTDDPSFVRGWECCRVYSRLCESPDEVTATIHSDSDEQVLLIASRLGYTAELRQIGDGWSEVTLTHNS